MMKDNFFKKAAFMKNKTLFLGLVAILIISFAYFAFAEFTSGSLNTPLDNSWDTDGTVEFNCTVAWEGVNDTLLNLSLYTNMTESWTINATNSTVVENNTAYNFTVSGIPDGIYVWNCLAYDNGTATQWANTTGNYTIKVDQTAPILNNPTPANSGFIADASSTLFNITLTEQNIDLSVNVTLYYKQSGGPSYSSDTLSCTGTAPTYYCSKTLDLHLLIGDGQTLNFFFNTTDSAGHTAVNGTQASPLTATVDQTSPVVNTLNNYANDSWTTDTSVIFGFKATDTNNDTCILYHNASTWGANVTKTYTSNADTNFSAITLSNGHYLWNVLCNDSAGHTAWNGDNYTLKVDATDPAASLDIPTNDSWDSDGSVTFGYTPSDTNLEACILYGNFSNSWAANETNSSLTSGIQINNTLSLEDGYYIWNVKCNDSAGNSAFNGTNYTIKVDKIAPVVNTLNNYANNSWTTSKTVTFGFNMTDTNNDTCILYHNASTWGANVTKTYTSNEDTNFSAIIFASDGHYLWNVLCNDSAGHTAWNGDNYTLKVDATDPAASLDIPTNDSWDSDGSVTFGYTPSDTNLEACILYGNFSNSWAANETNSSLTSGIQINNTLSLEDGYYIWNVKCNDSAGNSAFNGTNYTIKVDTVSPILNNPTPANSGFIADATTTLFNITLTEQNINLSLNVTLYYMWSGAGGYSSDTLSCTGTAPTYYCSKTLNLDLLIGNGQTLNFFFNTTDSAGHTAVNGTQTIPLTATVDETGPSKSEITNPATNDTWKTSMTDIITINMTDTIDSTLNYNIFVNGTSNATGTVTGGTATNVNLTGLQDGGYYEIIAQATDDAGNSLNSSSKTLYYDATAPVVNTLNNYGNNTWINSNTITFGFNATDTNNDTCILYHNASTWVANETVAYTSNADTNFSSITLADGHYVWNVLCNDSAGQTDWNSDNYTLKVDNTNPVVTSFASNDTDNIVRSSDYLNFSVTVTETNINTVKINGTSLDQITGTNVWYNINQTDNFTGCTTTGACTFLITATDYAGNENATETLTITIDDDNPGVFSFNTNDTDNIVRSADYLNFSVTVNDTGGGSVSTVTMNGTSLTSGAGDVWYTVNQTDEFTGCTSTGACTFLITATDNVSNVNATETLTITIDDDNPGVFSFGINDSDYNVTSTVYLNFSVTVNDTGGGSVSTVTMNGTSLTQGGTTWYTVNRTVDWTDCTTNGLCVFGITATDNVSNVNSTETITLMIDTTVPTVSLTSPTGGYWTNDNTTDFKFTATDTLSSVLSCTLYVGGTAYGTNSSVSNYTSTTITYNNTAGMDEGDHEWYVNCTDGAGNEGAAIARTVKIDVTAPTFTISQPTLNQEVTSSAFTILSGVATDGIGSQFSGVDSCAVEFTDFDGVSSGTISGTVDFNTTHCTGTATIQSAAANGNGTLTLKLLDHAGNLGSATKYIDYTQTDPTAPRINTIELNGTQFIAGSSILVTVNATDNTAVSSVTADGVALTQYGDIWNGTVTAASGIGSHAVIVVATDAVGKIDTQSVSYEVVSEIDTTAPSLGLTTWPLSNVNAEPFWIIVDETNNETGLTCRYELIDVANNAYRAAGMLGEMDISTFGVSYGTEIEREAGSPNGVYNLTFSCTDSAGNSASTWVNFTINITYNLHIPGHTQGFIALRPDFILSRYALQGTDLTDYNISTVINSTAGLTSQRLDTSRVNYVWGYIGSTWYAYNTTDAGSATLTTFNNSIGYYVLDLKETGLGRSIMH